MSINDDQKRNILIIATGGTIAGTSDKKHGTFYSAAQLNIDDILSSVPEIFEVANIKCKQFANIASQNFLESQWVELANYINEQLSDDQLDGVIVTHGTDTMEETAYFLNLTINASKPVILTGSMRPATSRSPDGPNNLYSAVLAVRDRNSCGRGVLVVANEKIFSAHDVSKVATTNIEAFTAPNYGPLGYISDEQVSFQRTTEQSHTLHSEFSSLNVIHLPKVPILYSHVGSDPFLIDACLNYGVKGIVFAGTGNGNVPSCFLEKFSELQKNGIYIVRASRAYYGATTSGEITDSSIHSIPAGVLNPHKAKILLQLCISQNYSYSEIKECFIKY